jgi:electron transfer flavoprotein beta subunit
VRAIEFKEQTGQGNITVLCVGGADVEPTLRKALAIGADDAVRVNAEPLDGMYVAQQIAAYAKGKGFDFIFFGKESIDGNGSEVPGMVAEYLDLPFVSQAIHLTVEGGKAKVHRELDGGYENLEASIPAVISCQKGIAEWRIPNMRGIMTSKTKKLDVVQPVAAEAGVTTVKLEIPPSKGGVTYIDPEHPEKLVEILVDKGLI